MTRSRAIERLEELSVEEASSAQLVDATRWIRLVRGFLDAKEAEVTRRAQELHATDGTLPAEDLLSRHGRSSRREAEKTRRRADVLGHAPAMAEQLSAGRIGPEHADALAAIADRLSDAQREQLLACDERMASAATSRSPEQFRRFLNREADRITADDGLDRSERQRDAAGVTIGVDTRTGMGFIHGTLHPDDHQQIKRALTAEVDALRSRPEYEGLRRDQLNAIALTNLVTGARATQRRPNAAVAIHVDLTTMVDGLHEHGICEYSDGTPVPIETVRRHACEAGIIPVVLGGASAPLDVGRAERLATPGQRAALRSMYRTCAVAGCEQTFDDCDIHHLLEWTNDLGPTDLANLLPACAYHHHRAHEGRWRLELDPATRELAVWLPNGELHSRCLPDLVAARTAGLAA